MVEVAYLASSAPPRFRGQNKKPSPTTTQSCVSLASALKALAPVDIHDDFVLALSTEDLQIGCDRVWPYSEQPVVLPASRASKPSISHE